MNENLEPSLTPEGDHLQRVIQTLMDNLSPLVGTWKGQGEAVYPTINTYEYRESLSIRQDDDSPYLTYEQSTALIDGDGHRIRKSHWEAGLIRPLADGRIEIACVQSGGRVEILRGEVFTDKNSPDLLTLRLQSELVVNDDRVRSTNREWSLKDNQLSYEMNMATTMVEAPTIHLKATLAK